MNIRRITTFIIGCTALACWLPKVRLLVSGFHVIGITADGLKGGADPRREGVVLGH